MASKSKRRRRVLGASCILAALIIAASSFAWFTSKDEVTNRLTANADYGVSIVESFAPPANWLPGETVNKDVYAVNTGSVAAFVKESVSGVLDYTFEKKLNAFDAAKCIELTSAQVTAIDGVTMNEGGGFLAWTDAAGVSVGAVNSAREADEIGNAWHPTVTGTYIFRRSIDNSGNSSKYTYAGYYYVAPAQGEDTGKYYKIVIGDDAYRAEETPGTDGNANSVSFDIYVSEDDLGADVQSTIDRTDGSFTGSPKIAYVENQSEKANVFFTFEENNGKPRLVVNYSADAPTHDEDGITYDASAWAARKEVDYYNKLGEYNVAAVRYEQAAADNAYAAALADARDKLLNAAKTRLAAQEAKDTADTGLNEKWTDLQDAVNNQIAAYNVQKTTLSGKKIENLFDQTTRNRINNNLVTPKLESCQANLSKMETLWSEMQDLDGQLWDQLKTIVNASEKLTPTQVQNAVDRSKALLDQIVEKCNAYSDAYSGITSDPLAASELNLNAADTSANKDAIDGVATAVAGLKDTLDTTVGEYETAYNKQVSDNNSDTNAQAVWVESINNYNNSVAAAKAKYNSIVSKDSPEIYSDANSSTDGRNNISYTNNSSRIVPYWSMNRTAGSEPGIDADTAATVDGFTDIANQEFPTGAIAPDSTVNPPTAGDPEWKNKADKYDPDESALQTAMNNAKTAADTAKTAYDDAKADASGSSTIKIYVNLATDFANYWVRDNNTDGTQAVDFYLAKILTGGETSGKLIDSVEFANTVTAKDYKNLTFDLNVGLDSAQITYGDDQKTINTDAVTKPAFTLKPTLTNDKDISTAVTWATD